MNAKVKFKHTVLSSHVGWIKNVRQILKDNCFVEIVWTKLFTGFFIVGKLKKKIKIYMVTTWNLEKIGFIPLSVSTDPPETKRSFESAKKSVQNQFFP